MPRTSASPWRRTPSDDLAQPRAARRPCGARAGSSACWRDAGVRERQPQLVLELAGARLDHHDPPRPASSSGRSARSGRARGSSAGRARRRRPRRAALRPRPWPCAPACCRRRAARRRPRSGSGRRAARPRSSWRTWRCRWRLWASRSASARWIEQIRLRAVRRGRPRPPRPGSPGWTK